MIPRHVKLTREEMFFCGFNLPGYSFSFRSQSQRLHNAFGDVGGGGKARAGAERSVLGASRRRPLQRSLTAVSVRDPRGITSRAADEPMEGQSGVAWVPDRRDV